MSSKIVLRSVYYCLWIICGCNAALKPKLEEVVPLNGTTMTDTALHPSVMFFDVDQLDLFPETERKVVLYDLTLGAHQTVPGEVVVEGTRLQYRPDQALEPGHQFELEIQRTIMVIEEKIAGPEFEVLDATELPEETISWPLKLRFSTGSSPQVRSAYRLSAQGRTQIIVRFSQAMDILSTENALLLTDFSGKAIDVETMVWPNSTELQLALKDPLEEDSIYQLKIAGSARAGDGIFLDGDGDGIPGEKNDAVTLKFTGIQRIILSRFSEKRGD